MTLAATLLLALTLSSPVTPRARYLMGTVCEVSVASEAEAEAAFAEAQRIESFLSTWKRDSELSRVNRGEAAPGSELRALLDTAAGWSQRTGGAFNPRVLGLVEVWKTRVEGALPAKGAIADALRDPRFEEGAFGKGYAIDRMLERIESAQAMIDFGGQLAVRGSLRVTIADPERRDHPVLALTLANASLSTTSGSEKTFTAGGRTFSHLFDPRSGEALPPRGSVSVIANDALTADILSTALYVMGEDEGLRWADANGVAAIYIHPKHSVRRSSPARERTRDLELLDRKFAIKD
jgi:FAD:protein FMN transferase